MRSGAARCAARCAAPMQKRRSAEAKRARLSRLRQLSPTLVLESVIACIVMLPCATPYVFLFWGAVANGIGAVAKGAGQAAIWARERGAFKKLCVCSLSLPPVDISGKYKEERNIAKHQQADAFSP